MGRQSLLERLKRAFAPTGVITPMSPIGDSQSESEETKLSRMRKSINESLYRNYNPILGQFFIKDKINIFLLKKK
jgi:hypothetical protein